MKKKIFALLLISILFITACGKKKESEPVVTSSTKKINLTNFTLNDGSTTDNLKRYTNDDFDSFLNDYENGNLPDVYVTEFLFDGVSTYKIYDLDDFEESGNDVEIENFETVVLNVKSAGDYELSGDLTGMIAVNSNGISDDINLILNGVNIDTDSKKIPAIYVYNKDMTYTDHKVTIKTANGSKNYIEGGKLKKVSLIPNDELTSYASKYSGDASTWFNLYTNYYGVYTSSQVKNILFATVTADNEDLQDGDPYYSYKASGAISSDIDLYFEGTGYLEVTSKNKEGIETKGNLSFIGGTGDYVVSSQDDCLNTTTKSSAGNVVHNSLVIDVNSLTAIVSMDADEGDAIDSNGTLTINGGTIYAFAHPGQDAGLDSETGTYINGGTVIATGDMYDQINSSSTQNFMVLSFNGSVTENTLITLLDSNDNVVFSYVTDRNYTNLIYSSSNLKEGTYYLYKDGETSGTLVNGVYINITNYTKGTLLGYSSTGIQGGMGGGQMNGDRPEMPNGEAPDMSNFDGNIPDMNGERPERPDGNNMPMNQDEIPNMGNFGGQGFNNGNMGSATNKEFTVTGISNLFSGVAEYTEE